MLYFYFLILAFCLAPFDLQAREISKTKDGFFHVALFGQYSPGSKIGFASYISGTTASPTITPGKAEFATGNFTTNGLEFIFFTNNLSGFSIGYSLDSSRDIEHKQVTYDNGTSTRTYLYPRDKMENSAILFNYYLVHTPDRGYIVLGLNYSNPKWTQATTSNSTITLSGDLGAQIAFGFSLLKGVIFDIAARTTAIKMRSDNAVATTFEDFGRGQITDLLVGFKFIF